MLKWNGDEIQRKWIEAAKRGVDKTMAQSVQQAKSHHPGFNNVTGTLEGSVNIIAFAQEDGNTVRGTWGSADVSYAIWIELSHGPFLRAAADVTYPNLAGNIKEAYDR